MVKKIHKISICMLAAVSLFSGVVMANDLNRLDIQKSSSASSTLNVTIYTSAPYDDNVAVTKKSDNKYVILMPNVSSSNISGTDFSSIKDIVSDVDIKTVADGANGYTKVTLTTTKPVAITTTSRKSTPLTPEQKAYKNLIAQSRGYGNAAARVTEVKPASAPAVNKKAAPAKPKDLKQQDQKPKEVKAKEVKPSAVKTAAVKEKVDDKKLSSLNAPVPAKVKADNKNTEKNVNIIQHKVENTFSKVEKDILSTPKDSFTLADLKIEKDKNDRQAADNSQLSVNTEESFLPETLPAESNDLKSNINDKGTQPNMFITIVLLLCSMLGLGYLFKQLKNQLQSVVALKKSFKENLSQQPLNMVKKDYSDITDNKNLSWREKYQQYINTSMPIQPGKLKHVGNGEYQFVNSSEQNISELNKLTFGYSDSLDSKAQSAVPMPKKANKLTSYNRPAANISPKDVPPIKKVKNQDLKPQKAPKLEIVEKPVIDLANEYKKLEDSLERTLHNSPSTERLDFNDEEVFKQLEENFNKAPGNKEPVIVHNEDDKISQTVRKLPKLRAFANKIALEETKRNLPLPKKRSEILKAGNLESKHVDLEKSDLYSNPRKFENANLSSADLISGRNNRRTKISVTKPVETSSGYTMATIDEFFDAMDSSSNVTAPASLASRVADSLGRMSSEFEKINPQTAHTSDPLDGKKIMAGYNINKTSGFYIVSDDQGQSSLIGKINNNITILKVFNHTIDNKLQVRMDDPNVYMVRAGGERYLVEVNNNKMGVLLEL